MPESNVVTLKGEVLSPERIVTRRQLSHPSSETARALRTADGITSPRLDLVTLIEPPSKFGTAHLAALNAEELSGILLQAHTGKLERWNDLADKMLQSDDHLRSVYETRIGAVTGAKWEVVPGRAKPGQEELAKAAAEFCGKALEEIDDLERLFADLLDGAFRGLAALEHHWYRIGSTILTAPFWVPGKNFRYNESWIVEVYTGARTWIPLPEGKFVLHTPRTMSAVPTKTALLYSCVWPWAFKYWALNFWVNGSERHGNPLLVGKVPRNADATVRAEFKRSLQALSEGQIAILDEGTEIVPLSVNYSANADVWDKLIAKCDAALSKAVLGSTLNVEIGDTGGAYNAAVSQRSSTIRPRARRDAKQLSGTIKRDLFGPLCRYNNHRFGGVIPPIPDLRWPELEEDQPDEIPQHIFQALYESGGLRRNELRRLAHMDPLPEGGDAFVTPPQAAPALPGFSRSAEVEQVPLARRSPMLRQSRKLDEAIGSLLEETPMRPMAELLREEIPLPKTSPTSSASPTNPLASALEALSEDR